MKKTRLFFSVVIFLLVLSGGVFANRSNIIISPNRISGIPGELIDTSSIFVQEVGINTVKLHNISIRDEDNKILLRFPKESGKYQIASSDDGSLLGFIDIDLEISNKISITNDIRGEFLFYQDGQTFNSLRNAKTGDLYFWRRPSGNNPRPIILKIGFVEQGFFTPNSFLKLNSNVLSLER